MSDVVALTRDARGDWQPEERPEQGPLWAWPPRPLKSLKWVFGYPGYLLPWNAFFCAVAIAAWAYLTPELSRMAEFRIGWIVEIYLRNVGLLVLVVGGLHLRLYTFKAQGTDYKFSPKWLGEDSPTFLWGNQLRDNIFWCIASGCTVWTAYEVPMMWAYANGVIPYMDWETQPVAFVLLLGATLLWQETHFDLTHRPLHWKPLYRAAHYLHHKNVNIGPWSGISMHPIEHVIYFSCVLIFLIVPSHPIHTMFLLQVAALGASVGHTGFDKIVVKGRLTLPGEFFHYLHHRYFECNYGTLLVPFDHWFGTFHDGSPEAHTRMNAKWSEKRT